MTYRSGIAIFLGFFMLTTLGWAAEETPVNSAGHLGFGTVLGQPTGATAKLWMSPTQAVDAVVGYHFNHNFNAHVDYLLHSDAPTHSWRVNGTALLYAGLGARILAGDDTQFGFRIPLGIGYIPIHSHVEFFAELAPIIDVSNLGADIDGLIGLRLYAF